jgi:polar amino acid transport system substrate-binding protein
VLVALLMLAAAPAGEPLRWGADAQGGAPFVFQDPMDPNRLIGFEVDLAGELAQKLGREPRPVHGAWDKLLELLDRGDFDSALNGIEWAEEKKRVALLTRPYFRAAEHLTIRRGDTSAPRTLAALATRRVGTLPGSLGERIARGAGADVRTYDGRSGRDLHRPAVGPRRTRCCSMRRSRYIRLREGVSKTCPATSATSTTPSRCAARTSALLGQLNAALDALERDGTLQRILLALGPERRARARHRARAMARRGWSARAVSSSGCARSTRQVLPLFGKGAALTLVVSLLAMTLAVLLGVLLAVGRRYGPAVVRVGCVAYIELFRGTPLLVQLTLVYFGLPELGLKLSPFVAGVLALGLNYAAAEAENYRAGLESVPSGQLEASAVLGFTRWQTLRFVVGPQAVRVSIPPMTNDFIALLKDSSLVSLVTLTELTKTYTNLASSMRDHLGLGLVVAAFYLLIGLPFAQLARRAEAYFGRHLRRSHA